MDNNNNDLRIEELAVKFFQNNQERQNLIDEKNKLDKKIDEISSKNSEIYYEIMKKQKQQEQIP